MFKVWLWQISVQHWNILAIHLVDQNANTDFDFCHGSKRLLGAKMIEDVGQIMADESICVENELEVFKL